MCYEVNCHGVCLPSSAALVALCKVLGRMCLADEGTMHKSAMLCLHTSRSKPYPAMTDVLQLHVWNFVSS